MIDVSQIVIVVGLFSFLVFTGVPIAFSICFPSVVLVLMNGIEPMVAPQMFIKGPQSFTLLAVPFFILAGNMMNTAGVSKRIFDFCLSLIGHVRGGLAYVNVLASMVFAGISGSAMADAAGLGKIEMKIMKDEGYDIEFSAAITAASSVIGPIIPPSIIMVIYANEAKISVGNMFKAGFVPGVLIGLCLMLGVFYHVKKGTAVGERRRFSWKGVVKAARDSILSMIAPIIILVGMFSGSFTPTEAGVVAVVYSMLVGFLYGEMHWNMIPGILRESAVTTANCMFMTAGATLLGWVVTFTRLPVLLAEMLFAFTNSKYVFLFIVCIFVLILGCLIESIAGCVIIAPILLPIAIQYGIDPMHFGMILCYGMMIGCITPPMGPCLFAVCGFSGARFERTVVQSVPFFIAHFTALLIVTYVPTVSLWLPSMWK